MFSCRPAEVSWLKLVETRLTYYRDQLPTFDYPPRQPVRAARTDRHVNENSRDPAMPRPVSAADSWF
jgi:hypothetical protein